MTRRMTVLTAVALVLGFAHGPAWAAEGIAGSLTVDPERPQTATGTVRVDMNLVRTGIDKRDADMRSEAAAGRSRARFATTFTDHGMQGPQLLIFKVSNEIQLESDLTVARQ